MAKFDQGMESMADTYTFETASLLEQLDGILMQTENENEFGEDEINEIFRIMHTIKGSSAMMGLDNMSHLAHAVEDMFYIIREDKPVIKDKRELFDIVFNASDLLKAELDTISDDTPPTDMTSAIDRIERYAAALKGVQKTASARTELPLSGEFDPQGMIEVPDDSADSGRMTVRVRFEEGTAMPTLRAMLVLRNLETQVTNITTEPSDITNDPDAEEILLSEGLLIEFDTPENKTAVLNSIKDNISVASAAVVAKVKSVPANTLTTIKVTFEPDCRMENLRALMVVNNIREYCEILAYEPSDIEDNSQSAALIAEDGFIVHFKARDCTDDDILRTIGETPSVKSVDTIYSPASAAAAADDAGSDKELTPAQANAAVKQQSHSEKKSSSLISVKLSKLDELLNMVGEIVIAEAMVTANPDLKGLRLDNFQKAARQLRKLNSEMQDIVMSIRMVPISGAFSKMTRIVRDMRVKLGKNAELVLEGEDTEVDKSIIDNLGDPLMHMVRNSMDHGIEDTEEERIAAGKPPAGTIKLSAYSSSGEVVIVVSDDGKGMDAQKLLDKAEKNGILTKPRSEYTDKEAFNLIMLPGFSTNETVTEFSGRGVGMDVVKQNIEKMGGTVSIDSQLGRGTSFTVKIPLSLSIVEGMEVSVGRSIFTIPIPYITESFKLQPRQLLTDTDGREMVMVRGECYPLVRLNEFYELKDECCGIFDGIIILVEADGKKACLLADELIGEQQVVIKPFSPLLAGFGLKQYGMSGCSILGDGSITIILDVANIISEI